MAIVRGDMGGDGCGMGVVGKSMSGFGVGIPLGIYGLGGTPPQLGSGGVYQRFHDYLNAVPHPYKIIPKWKRLTKEQRMDERLQRRRKAIRDRWMARIGWTLGIAAALPVVIAGLAWLWRMAIWSTL